MKTLPTKLLSLLTLCFMGLSFNVQAQNSCSTMSVNYNAGQFHYAIGINNQIQEETDWRLHINGALYKLDAEQFSMPSGVQLSITTSQNADGSYDYVLSPNQPIRAHQFLNFVYRGAPENDSNDYSADVDIDCEVDVTSLCSNVNFNFFNEQQFSFGFGVQNQNSVELYPYEVHIDNASYRLDTDLLTHTGFDFIDVDKGDGTFDYYFVAQEPIAGFGSSPTVSSSQDFGPNPRSNARSINCGNEVVGTGNDGGLESHGGLASKIALRTFRRSLGINHQPRLKNDNAILSDLAPQHIIRGDNLIETSPTDLVPITRAETIWAGDYFINETRFASIFASKTSDEIYDHTKAICDRVKGSELAAVEVVNIEGHDAILSIIRRPNNTIEYAISFSLAYETFGDFTMSSYWSIDEYASSPNYLNYQVWTNSRAKTIAAVEQILETIESNNYSLDAAKIPSQAPQLFATRAHYRFGKFNIELHNQLTEPTMVSFEGYYTTKEVDGVQVPFTTELEILPGETSIALDVASGNVFDAEISFQAANSQKDVIYMADGAWGLDFIESSTTINQFNITDEDRTASEDDYLVERGISLSGTTDSYVSIFKQLLPGSLPVDMSSYNTISFDSRRTGTYQVTLITADNTDPSLNMSYALEVEADREVNIPFSLFSNVEGAQLDPSNITTLYIAFIKNQNDSGEFEFEIENIRFTNLEENNLNIRTDNESLHVFPNPTSDHVSVTHFFANDGDALINVYNPLGALIYQQKTAAYKGLQLFEIDLQDNLPGLYVINLIVGRQAFTQKVLLIPSKL